MFVLHDRPHQLCDGINRRELMRIGGIGTMGLTLPSLLQARETAPGVLPTDKSFGKAKNVIFLYLTGGPPQHETFDPKPNAPVEIRGEFKPVSTDVPGIHFCELLPRTARMASKLAVVRSMATNDNIHGSSGAWVLTGYKYQGSNSRTIQPTDWPYFGSIIKKLKPSDTLPPLSTVWLPDLNRLNENVTPAGQTGGFLGKQWDPDRFIGDPNAPGYQVKGLQLSDIPPLRLQRRARLLQQVERHFNKVQRGTDVQLYGKFQQQAFDLMTSSKARNAFSLQLESDRTRERYGRNRWGQCVLLARRLIEAGVRLVHVQWPREPGDNAVDNPKWDTHDANSDRLEDVLCPQFDVGFTALIEDLEQRGLLQETLVVAIGEFGRTPKINKTGGRDHWGAVFSCVLAGAGISAGQVYGASDSKGAYPAQNRLDPGDLTATIFHLLGISHQGSFHDSQGREHKLTLGQPIYQVLGDKPATTARTKSTSNPARVPPYNDNLLNNTSFNPAMPLRPTTGSSRPRTWRAAPLSSVGKSAIGTVSIVPPQPKNKKTKPFVAMSVGVDKQKRTAARGAKLLLAQQVRTPMAGKYELVVQAAGQGMSKEFYEKVFLKEFECRLEFFQFTGRTKRPTDRKLLASVKIRPPYGGKGQLFRLEKNFVNPKPGFNFSFGLGMGVAIVIEKTTPGKLALAPSADQAVVRIERVELVFQGKERNDDVTV